MIYLTSDLHFNHDKQFIYGPRGFNTIYDMNAAIMVNILSTVKADDDLYVLGDLMLGDNEKGIEYVKKLPGMVHIILGNHDTNNRVNMYEHCSNVVEIVYATTIHYNGYHIYLSHYPTLTGNLENKSLKQMICNFFGHTHSKEKFYEERPYMYNVAVDAHDCMPVSIDEAINDMKAKVDECIALL